MHSSSERSSVPRGSCWHADHGGVPSSDSPQKSSSGTVVRCRYTARRPRAYQGRCRLVRRTFYVGLDARADYVDSPVAEQVPDDRAASIASREKRDAS